MIARIAFVMAALLALQQGTAVVLKAVSKDPFETETLTFATNVVPHTTNDEEVTVEATLYLPKQARRPLPVVVIVPSSGGVEDEREIYYARQLAASGIAALVVDSFSARGIEDTLYDQSQLDTWEIENDAMAALAKLAADKRIDPRRIAIMGVSKGGSVAMNTAFTVRRDWMDIDERAFAAHVAISPDCTWTMRNVATTGAPILFMLAELDDQTPAAACLSQADRIRATGNRRVDVKVYAGAHHAWEERGPSPTYDAKVENYSQCRVWVEDDGSMVSADTGAAVPEDDWHGWAKKTCMTLGATCCGGNSELRSRATKDIIAFLRRLGF